MPASTSRFIRNTAVLVKNETTYGADAVPTGSANAMLVSNMTVNPLNSQNVDRALIRPYFGGSEMLIGPASVECSFDVELVGAGTIAAAAAWGALARACGLAQTLTATVRADYTPITNGVESATIYYYDDGVLHKLLGAVGNMKIMAKSGGVCKASLNFIGLDGGISAVANPTVDLTPFKQPQVIYTASSTPVTLGATHDPATAPALAGGVAYPSMGLELDMGNQLAFNPFLGGEVVDITDRKLSGKVSFVLTPAQEVSFMAAVKAGTLQSMAMVAGNVALRRLMIFLASVQLVNPRKEDASGVRIIGYDLMGLPVSGNDELRLATSY